MSPLAECIRGVRWRVIIELCLREDLMRVISVDGGENDLGLIKRVVLGS